MRRNRVLYLALLLMTAGFYIASGGRGMLLVLLLLGGGAMLSLLSLGLGGRKLCLHMILPASFVAGREGIVRLELDSPGIFALGHVQVELMLNNLLFGSDRTILLRLEQGQGRAQCFELPLKLADCGQVQICVKRAQIFDLMGLVSVDISLPEGQTVLCYPPVPEFQVQLLGTESGSEGENFDATHRGQNVNDVFDLRDYQEGDSPKSIHWKLSGKLDKLIVREFGSPLNDRTMIFCDCRFGETTQGHPLSNGVLSMTAALSKGLLLQGHTHAISTFNGSFATIEVLDNESYAQAINALLCVRSGDPNINVVGESEEPDSFWPKLVYVTAWLDDQRMERLAAKSNLTVVLLTRDTEQMQKHQNYALIALPVSRLEQGVHLIEL